MALKPSVEQALEMRALPQQSSSTMDVTLGSTVALAASVLAPIKPSVGGMSVTLPRRGTEAEETNYNRYHPPAMNQYLI